MDAITKKKNYLIIIIISLIFISFHLCFRIHFLTKKKDFDIIDKVSYSSYIEDSNWYKSIADRGYKVDVKQCNIGFFPLFPIVLKCIFFVVSNPRYHYFYGTIANILFFIIALFYLYEIILMEDDDKNNFRIIPLMILIPNSVYFFILHSETLYFMTSLIVYYYYKKERYFLVFIFGILLTLSRLNGIVLPAVLIIDYFKNKIYKKEITKKKIMEILLIFGTFLGIFSFMLFQYILFSNPLIFIKIQNLWLRKTGFECLFKSINTVIFNPFKNFDTVYIIIAFIILIYFIYKKDLIKFLFLFFSIIIPLFSSTWYLHRYILVMFPIYIFLNRIVRKSIVLYLLTGIIFFYFQIIFLKKLYVLNSLY